MLVSGPKLVGFLCSRCLQSRNIKNIKVTQNEDAIKLLTRVENVVNVVWSIRKRAKIEGLWKRLCRMDSLVKSGSYGAEV